MIEEEAARLLVRLEHDPGDEERAAIFRWIEEDPAHAVAFARAEAAWQGSERLKACSGDIPGAKETEADAVMARPLERRRLLAGALLAMPLFAGVSVFIWRKFQDSERFSTEVGEVRDVRLADGTVMHLNTGSSAEVQIDDKRRIVRLLSGEASFDVAHDKQRPFDVQARSATIRALGTSFNVRLRDSLVELMVTEGTVAVAAAAAKTPLEKVSAGRGAAIRRDTIALTRLDTGTVRQRLAWHDRMIALDGESVEQAVAEFNRYRASPVVIGDPRVAPIRVGGLFRTDESGQFLAALEQSFPIQAVQGEDGSVLLLYREE